MLPAFARLGYASKAVIYGIVGVFSILAAAQRGGAITDTSGALRIVLEQPLGHLLLLILAIGLCGYALWRLTDAITDPDHDGSTPMGLLTRIGNGVRGCVYGAVGIEAVRLLRGLRSSNRDEAEQWASRLLDVPLGDFLIVLAGVAITGYASAEIVKGVRGRHDPKIDWAMVSARLRRPLQHVCRFGVSVRGSLLATLGVFLVRAALTRDPNQAAGARESLIRLSGMFEGRWWLTIIAIGVLAYAADQAIHAGYRRIQPVA